MNREIVAEEVFQAVVEAVPHISSGMLHRREHVGEENPSDERQLEADVWANELLKEKITSIDGVGMYASEEEEAVTLCGDGLSVSVDPLDGSSNIPTNNLVGTIVGIYDEELPCSGEKMLEAFYVVYGPVSSVVRSDGETVEEYVIESNQDEAEAIRAGSDLELPDPTVYGFGGNKGWFKEFRKFEATLSRDLKLRYGGSLVGDVNQVLHHGGIFGYPAKESAENGKLRVQFEAIPVGFIFEALDRGSSTDGGKELTSIEPSELHERTPVFVGNESLVAKWERRSRRHS